MKRIQQIILISLVIINSLGYDWLHCAWHFRNGPQSVHPSTQFNYEPDGKATVTIKSGRQVSFSDPGSGMLTDEDDDKLVNTSQPIHNDWKVSDFVHCPDAVITQHHVLREYGWTDPDIPGFHYSIFRPPRAGLANA